MADKNSRLTENTEGEYYVDSNCIACGLCVNEAPECFQFDDGENYAYVFKQPSTDQEKISCSDSMDQCPVESIGNDGL